MSARPILVIKHGALGDIILATAAFAAIRANHPDARMIALTSKPYAELLAQTPYFDDVWVDPKPRLGQFKTTLTLARMLRSQPWQWVYDLQTSTRSTWYQWLLARPWPNISNVSRWSNHGYTDPARHKKHAFENLRLQLAIAGIAPIAQPDVSWLTGQAHDWGISAPYALLVPGGSAHRPEKRWPAEHYATLAAALAERGITPVLIGSDAERATLEFISAKVKQVVNLGGATSFGQLADLARGAQCAIGNDTGPMHIIAATGCPATVLFSHASNPDYSAPIGPAVTILRERDLRDLSVDQVHAGLTERR